MKKFRVGLLICAIAICIFLSGCYRSFNVVALDISEYPSKLYYFVEEDQALDLDGGWIDVYENPNLKRRLIMDDSNFTVSHNVDFNIEGVYPIEFRIGNNSCKFAIQVISRKYVN